MPLNPDVATAGLERDVAAAPSSLAYLHKALTINGAGPLDECDFALTGIHASVDVTPDGLLEAAGVMHDASFMFECALGIDRNPGLEVVYLFRALTSLQRIRMRVKLAPGEVSVPSLTSIYRGADWYEREMRDMYGFAFPGHPHLQPLLLPPALDFYPLRKDFHGQPVLLPEDQEDIPELEVREAMAMGHASPARRDFFLNMGPQHPSTHGVLRILLHVEGEQVLGGRCHLGYSHRGTEKAAEGKQYVQLLPYTDRIDYLSPLNYNLGYAALLERALQIEVPERAQAIRVIMAELGRISSHLVWLGTFLLDLGAITPFLYCFEDREQIMTVFERVTGQRLTTSYIVVGGVRHDVPPTFVEDVRGLVKMMRARLPEFKTLITDNEIFVRRTVGVGKITSEQVRDFGITGPNARGAGVDFDLRRDEPLPEYAQLTLEIPTDSNGDCQARSMVRMHEFDASLDLIEQALLKLEDGPSRAKVPRNLKVPAGEYYSATEGPRGLVGWYLVADSSMKPYRFKVRVPSFANLQILEDLLPGHRVADVVSILGSIDVVIPEIDR
jgi:NADH-quinone oxidoreductase subunit D